VEVAYIIIDGRIAGAILLFGVTQAPGSLSNYAKLIQGLVDLSVKLNA